MDAVAAGTISRAGVFDDEVGGGYFGFEIWGQVVKDGGVADNGSVTLKFCHSHAHA